MSASLPWIFMRWLATHLVLISLMLFALAAVPVFGWVEVPALVQWTPAHSSKTAQVAQAPPVATVPQASAGPRFKPAEEIVVPAIRPPSPLVLAAPAAVPSVPGFRPPGLVPLTEQTAPTRDELVQQARRLYWNGEFEAAETAYVELLARFPGDADLFGELGNLYRGMGRPDQARDAYYAAGLRLKAVGELEKLKVIRDLFDAEGDARVTELTP
jgi:hypothetical protein